MAFRHPLTAVPMTCVAPMPESLRTYLATVDAAQGREFTAAALADILEAR
jgi:23S rRNA pseudouridine955/2504/2580 synthase